jgi:hypothetical protein
MVWGVGHQPSTEGPDLGDNQRPELGQVEFPCTTSFTGNAFSEPVLAAGIWMSLMMLGLFKQKRKKNRRPLRRRPGAMIPVLAEVGENSSVAAAVRHKGIQPPELLWRFLTSTKRKGGAAKTAQPS